jgi:hypothetical protein
VEVSQLSLDQIIACSPGLEDLNFINCARYFKLIDSKVLKSLMLDGFIDRDDGFTIAAPHLIHFECLGCPLEYICWRERPSLESAHIDTCGPTFDDQSDFTGILSCAKTLTLLNFQGSDVKVCFSKDNMPFFSCYYHYSESKLFGNNAIYIVCRFFCAYLVFDSCCC